MTDRKRALIMLAGCPDGATEDTLATHGFDKAMLEQLVADGRLRTTQDHYRLPRSLIVTRYFITDAGTAEATAEAAPEPVHHRRRRHR